MTVFLPSDRGIWGGGGEGHFNLFAVQHLYQIYKCTYVDPELYKE